WLFGKRFDSLKYDPKGMEGEFKPDYVAKAGETMPMPPKRIERTLRRDLKISQDGKVESAVGETTQVFARIYSFSYEAHYYRLPRPLLFLVNDLGQSLAGGQPEAEESD